MKAIVFDFGNVLGFFDHHRATSRLEAYAELSSEDMFERLYGGGLEDDFEAGRLTGEQFIAQVRALCGLRCSDAIFRETFTDIFWPNEPLCALLPELHSRYRLVLGSNTNELHAARFTRQFADVLRHFDGLVLSYQIGVRKPNADFFHHCLVLAGCRPEECLFIDDVPANVAGAIACGWQGIVYSDMQSLRARLRKLRIL